MPDQFHFLHPLWLLALIPLGGLLWLLRHNGGGDDAWRRVVDPELLPLLLRRAGDRTGRTALWLLGAGWLIAVLALADPTWEQRPRPLFESRQGLVILLDLSRSMAATDVTPSRLFRARLKVEDILDRRKEGQTGLAVFAGDAFGVIPLTSDTDTIRAMLRVLSPDLMPVQGSRLDLGLKQAGELLHQAGLERGGILAITDGMESDAAIDAAADLKRQGYRVSVLGVGTAEGAPVPDGRGGSLRDDGGRPVIAGLDQARLQRLASAGGGRYATLRGDDGDLDLLLTPATPAAGDTAASDQTTHAWKEQGPLLVLLLLPLAALAFRRGWLLTLVLATLLTPLPEPALAAADATAATAAGLWTDLWQRRDQQAAAALAAGDAATAARLARDPLRRGSAEYRRGDYAAALEAFGQAKGPDAAYNRGNALARLGRYRDAIAAYDEALRLRPGMEDARANREAVERLLKQQQQQQQQSKNRQGGQGKSSPQSQQQQGDTGKPQQNQGQGDQQQNQGQAGERQQASSDRKQSGQQSGNGAKDTAGKPGDKEKEQARGHERDQREQKRKGHHGSDSFAEAARRIGKESGDDSEQQQAASAQPQGRKQQPQRQRNERQEKARKAPARTAGRDRDDRQGSDRLGETPTDRLGSEERMAAEQWLRRIPDDPGGLLRRKFLYQYRQRANAPSGGRQAW